MTTRPTEETSARALGRWLDEHAHHTDTSGSDPPEELEIEQDVLQAIYSLRPDLAPAPRLTADDILASVTAGPLASRERKAAQVELGAVAEVVPFPTKAASVRQDVSDASAGPAPRASAPKTGMRRLLVLVGGTGGVGMALVAAATILLVATPILSPNLGAPPPTPAASTSPAVFAPAPVAEEEHDEVAQAEAAPPAEAPSAPVQARPQATPQQVSPEEQAFAIDGRAAMREEVLIPELAEPVIAAAPEAATGEASVGGIPATDAKEDAPNVEDLDQLRAKAAKNRSNGWRKDTPPEALAEIDRALTEAEALHKAGNPKAAGDKLIPFIKPPARAGMAVAIAAAEHYFAAGDADAAVGAAEMGLNLATASSPERSQLYLLLGDGLRDLGSPGPAADAYRMAR